jgi:hypothetical protein
VAGEATISRTTKKARQTTVPDMEKAELTKTKPIAERAEATTLRRIETKNNWILGVE